MARDWVRIQHLIRTGSGGISIVERAVPPGDVWPQFISEFGHQCAGNAILLYQDGYPSARGYFRSRGLSRTDLDPSSITPLSVESASWANVASGTPSLDRSFSP